MRVQYSKDTMDWFHGELLKFLTDKGPSTKAIILKGLGWKTRQLDYVLSSQPSWLVAAGVARSESKFGRVVLYHCQGEHTLGFCTQCGRKNFHPAHKGRGLCHVCVSDEARVDYTRIVPGVNLAEPTAAKPGSEEKIHILGARLDRGLPLFLVDDEYFSKPDWDESQEEPDDEDE